MRKSLITAKYILESLHAILEDDSYNVIKINQDPTSSQVKRVFYSLPHDIQDNVKENIDGILVEVAFWIIDEGELPKKVNINDDRSGGDFEYSPPNYKKTLSVKFSIDYRNKIILITSLILKSGEEDKGSFFYYRQSRVPYLEWLAEMGKGQPRDLEAARQAPKLLEKLYEYGPMTPFLDNHELHGVGKDIWEIGYQVGGNPYRLFYCVIGGRGIVILTGLRKIDEAQQDTLIEKMAKWVRNLKNNFDNYTVLK